MDCSVAVETDERRMLCESLSASVGSSAVSVSGALFAPAGAARTKRCSRHTFVVVS